MKKADMTCYQDLVSWNVSQDLMEAQSLTGLIAVLAACIGSPIAEDIAIDFSR